MTILNYEALRPWTKLSIHDTGALYTENEPCPLAAVSAIHLSILAGPALSVISSSVPSDLTGWIEVATALTWLYQLLHHPSASKLKKMFLFFGKCDRIEIDFRRYSGS